METDLQEDSQELALLKIIIDRANKENILMEYVDQLDISPLHDCCKEVYAEKIACSEILSVCQKTKTDKKTLHIERQFRITGSRCYALYTYKKNQWLDKSLKYFWPKPFQTKSTIHGIRYEPVARQE